MSDLVRFHHWIFDRNEILLVKIESKDNKVVEEWESHEHTVVVKLKNSMTFKLICTSEYGAIKELNLLTVGSQAKSIKTNINHFMIEQIDSCRDYIIRLELEIKKLMNSYKKVKDKENKLRCSKG